MSVVAILGTGAMATAVATLLARGGADVLVWGRDASHADWVVEDVAEEVPDAAGRVRVVDTARDAVGVADVVVPAVPWGEPLTQALDPLRDLLPGRVVLDVSNPYEMTALGPKLAMVVPGGSAAATLAAFLPPVTAHLHTFTQVRADALNDVTPGAALVMPYVLSGQEAAVERVEALLGEIRRTGWEPVRVGAIDRAATIEEGGIWAGARGAAGSGRLTFEEAVESGLLRSGAGHGTRKGWMSS